MAKIVTEHIHLAYEVAEQHCLQQMSKEKAVHQLVLSGMNAASAEMYVNFYTSLRDGKISKRTVSVEAIDYFLTQIWVTKGADALYLALKTLRAHLDYYEEVTEQMMVSKRAV